jgi:hypothetical protein
MLNFPWANESHDFTAESQQFLNLIINTLNTENTQLCPKNYSSSKVSENYFKNQTCNQVFYPNHFPTKIVFENC